MNILENHIVEVHNEEPYDEYWIKEFYPKTFVKVDMTIDCYGRVKRDTNIFETEDWKKIKKQGYFMA
ncbi:hypothetical protein RIB56_02945 [Priestia flexa]|uniref:Uncharacterized protein n=2 Tax=Priestia flexa TaxID=86664 RepID=A0ABU4J265_9BACI|nr:hypothetical protein [Priestia flexa]